MRTGAKKMNQVHAHNAQTVAAQVPLFSSSWIALFITLRDNFVRGDLLSLNPVESPKTGTELHPR
jgi:hypothetical protein